MGLLKPTGEKGLFLNKKEGKNGIFFSKNLTPHNGRNYLTVSVGSDGSLTTIRLDGKEPAVFKENSNGKGYNTVMDGYRIFANEITTKFGDAVVINVIENDGYEKKDEESVSEDAPPVEREGYGTKGFARN